MFNPRSIEDIQNQYLAALASTSSFVDIDTSQGSFAYTMSRAAAVVGYQQDLLLKKLFDSSLLITATSYNLDAIGLTFGIQRKEAELSEGYVLVLSQGGGISIPPNTILTNLSTGLQFSTQNSSTVSVLSSIESVVRIQALDIGSDSNLPAGTKLFSSDYPSATFTVGFTRLNEYEGDLTGGNDVETDESYRLRIAESISLAGTSSESLLVQALLAYPLVERAFVRTAAGGIVEVWVDAAQSYTEAQKLEISNYIKPYLTAGIIPVVIQAERVYVQIKISVEPFRNASTLDSLSERIASIIKFYILGLSVGEELQVKALQNQVAAFVKRVRIEEPTKNISPKINQILVPGDIKVIYPLSL